MKYASLVVLQLTLLEVLHVLGGKSDADAVDPRLLLAEALALHVGRHDCGRRRLFTDEVQKEVFLPAVTFSSVCKTGDGQTETVHAR